MVSVGLAEKRTWTDSTGKHKIRAEFKSLDGGKVTLLKSGGKEVKIPLGKLSAEDQAYAKKQAEEASPFEETEASPFEEETPGSDSGSGGEQGKLIEVDSSRISQIDLVPTKEEWKFDPPAASEEETVEIKRKRGIAIPAKVDFFERTTELVVNPRCAKAVIGYKLDDHKVRGGQTRLVLCDLVKGRAANLKPMSGEYIPMDLDEDGNQILMCVDDFHHKDRLELWKVEGSKLVKKFIWDPYKEEKHEGDRDVRWAMFLGNDRFATLSRGGKLAVWDLDTIRPIYYLQINGGCKPALSPDGKLLAFATKKEIGILDLEAEEVVAMKKVADHLPWPLLGFSPRGTRLACNAFSRLYVLDFENGELLEEMVYNKLNGANNKIEWVDEEYVLLGDEYLINADHQVPLWNFNGMKKTAVAGGVAWFWVCRGEDQPGSLVPGKIPHERLKEQLAKVMELPDFFVLKPGVTVKLNLDGLRGEKEKVREALTKQLEEEGFQVGDNGTIELVASVEDGKRNKEVAYRTFGQMRSSVYRLREYISRLKFVFQGKTVWEKSGNNVPGGLSLKEGETIQQCLRKHEKPNYAFFNRGDFPSKLIKPFAEGQDVGTLGQSEVTVSGVPVPGPGGNQRRRSR